ncbi:MAG: two pore domain potassium channel family protein [Candidatus Dadabacteria bacterium]|nr:two pore domain potassium channel family protein [Candidatus Dadabacteria bacterium]
MSKAQSHGDSIFLKILDRLRKKRFAYLTKSLLLLIIAYPYVQGEMTGQILLSLLTIVVMIMLVVSVSDQKRYTIIALLLTVPWFLIILLNFPLFKSDYSLLIKKEIVFAFLLFAYTTYRIFMHIIRSREVTAEILFASICVYILIGFTWCTLYVIIEILYPGSFVDTDGQILHTGPDFLFFSYTTLTTVGYGNIEAITDQARSLASLEAIAGQLYLTIMVARLVGLHISKPRAKESAA